MKASVLINSSDKQMCTSNSLKNVYCTFGMQLNRTNFFEYCNAGDSVNSFLVVTRKDFVTGRENRNVGMGW